MAKSRYLWCNWCCEVEIISVLDARKFPVQRLYYLLPSRSAGNKVLTPFGEELSVIPNGPVIIDNSSAFRRDRIPLVIPEINGHVLIPKNGKPQPEAYCEDPNCTTVCCYGSLARPLHCEFGIKKLMVSTYQAASGAGAAGMQELSDGAKSFLANEPQTYKGDEGYVEHIVTTNLTLLFLVDVPEELLYPMPKNATKKFNIEAGRFAQSLVFGDHGLELFVSGDQLLRGAALNAVPIG
ncbi:unnamed protein product [Peronospora belbahrii]|uniref:Semialdehyde dehydrogenase dimerisation domain-containing protein n=1 Tax=Peronospora belbahrii TaxID=622444 RepID=A0ABN8D742_9STRA|nr:unnamed protein product [Peronospora belbahrii]